MLKYAREENHLDSGDEKCQRTFPRFHDTANKPAFGLFISFGVFFLVCKECSCLPISVNDETPSLALPEDALPASQRGARAWAAL